ncbi:MAG: glycosyltransferase, partial [Patescibacteria group bacterium]|nr:glycosyltransferase [Patescibacteria group bacterium]
RQGLITMGHTVYIFAPQWGDEVNKNEKDVYRYPSVKVPAKIEASMVVPYSSKMDKIIEELDIDVIHAQHPNLLGTVAGKWAIKKGIPIVFTWHSLYNRYAHYISFVPEKLAGKWAMKNAAGFASDCDHIIVPTDSIVDVIHDAGVEHNRISTVSSGVDEDLFANPDGKKIKNQYNITDDKIVLGTVSRLTEEKNVIFLAESLAEILQKNKDTIFLCGGEGDLQDEMEEIFKDKNVSEQVIFTGKVARCDVKHYLDANDIFVYASTSETQGTIVTENMYIGKPIVAVGENGVGDLIENGVNGISVPEDKKEFIEATQKLLDDKNLCEVIGKKAYRIAREKYTTTVCTKNMLDVYQKAIDYYGTK